MFSETLNLFDEAEKVIDRVSGYMKASPEYAVSLERRLINNLIDSKGKEENRGYSGSVYDALSALAFTAGTLMENYLNHKVEYVKLLFSLLPVQYWTLFYCDLWLGLDNVIRKWDASPERPYNHFFTKPPTDYVRWAVGYRVKREQ